MKKFGMDEERDYKITKSLFFSGLAESVSGLGMVFYDMFKMANGADCNKTMDIIAGVALCAGIGSLVAAAKLCTKMQYTHYIDADSNSYGTREEHGDFMEIRHI